jgi:hypothetical protein
MNFARLVISAFTLVVASFAAFLLHRQARATEELARIESARRLDEVSRGEAESIRMKSARLSVSSYGDPNGSAGWGGSFGLLVRNDGQAVATGLSIDATRADNGNNWDFRGAPWPRDLSPGDEVRWSAEVSGSSARELKCNVHWSDLLGDHSTTQEVGL